MKKIILLAAVNLVVVTAMAQFKINLVMSSTPPATLSEWGNRRDVLTLIVSSQGSAAQEVKIKTEIKTTDGTVIGTVDLAKAKTFTFPNATTILTANDVMPLENMIFTGKYRSSLDKTGKLPSDNYTLCVQLVRPVDYAPASDQQCKNFYLATLQLPILMKPYNEENIDSKVAQTAIIFRWTPVVPQQREAVTYHIQVFEVLENQTPMQALRANQPLLDAVVRGATQYIWRPQLGDPAEKNINTSEAGVGTGKGGLTKGNSTGDPAAKNINTSEAGVGTGKGGLTKGNSTGDPAAKNINTSEDNLGSGKATFIWTIQTLDALDNPIIQTDGNGEARSEPIIFYVVPTSANKEKAKEKPIHGLKDTLKTQV
jgi:hypothetical protein